MARDELKRQEALAEIHARFDRQEKTIRWLVTGVIILTLWALVALVYLPLKSVETRDRLTDIVHSQSHENR